MVQSGYWFNVLLDKTVDLTVVVNWQSDIFPRCQEDMLCVIHAF